MATTLMDVQKAKIQIQIDHPEDLVYDIAKESILLFDTNANMFSLVAYPVAWHIDTFSDGQPSIENKTLFKMHSYDWSNGVGRG